MGMFDSVYVACPKCDATIELQSKSGPCGCIEYPSNAVPVDVLVDLDREARCPKCDRLVRIVAIQPVVATVEVVAVV